MCKGKGANGQTYFITSQRNFSTASGAAPYFAIMAYMADTVRKLGFQANVARCIQLDARFLLLLRSLSNGALQRRYFLLLSSADAHVEGCGLQDHPTNSQKCYGRHSPHDLLDAFRFLSVAHHHRLDLGTLLGG